MSDSRPLLQNRSFNVLWSCYGLAALGDAFSNIGLPLVVLEATGSLVQMGLVTAINGVALLLCGIFGGPLVDRLDPRRLMIACHLGCGLLYVSIPTTWLLLGPQMELVYVACGLGTFLNNVFTLANVSASARLVEGDQLTAVNSRHQGTIALAFMGGYVLAGLVSHHLGPAVAIGVDGSLLLTSAMVLLCARLRDLKAQTEESDRVTLQSVLAGCRFLVGHPVMRWVVLIDAVGILAATAALDLVIFRLEGDLDQSDDAIGVIFAVASVGAVLGAGLAAVLRERMGFAFGFLGAGVLKGLSIASSAWVSSPVALGGCVTAFEVGETVNAVNANAFRQESTPSALQGRVTGAYWTVTTALTPVTAAGATLIANEIGVTPVLTALGLAAAMVALLGAATPVRRWHPPREESI